MKKKTRFAKASGTIATEIPPYISICSDAVILGTLIMYGLAIVAQPQAHSQRLDNKPTVIKVGVAVLENTATRPVPVSVERDRLVNAINHTKAPKHSTAVARIEAVALDSSAAATAIAQARDLECEYVVFTDLTELRESGDPAPPPHPGDVRIGNDPVANDPNVGCRHDVERHAVIRYQLFRVDDPNPCLDTSASVREATTEDGVISILMGRVPGDLGFRFFD